MFDDYLQPVDSANAHRFVDQEREIAADQMVSSFYSVNPQLIAGKFVGSRRSAQLVVVDSSAVCVEASAIVVIPYWTTRAAWTALLLGNLFDCFPRPIVMPTKRRQHCCLQRGVSYYKSVFTDGTDGTDSTFGIL